MSQLYVGVYSGGPQGFALDRQMRVISLSWRRLEPTRFLSAALLCFPTYKKCGQKLVQVLGIDSCQHIAVRHLAGHALTTQSKALCQQRSTMANPLGGCTQTCWSGHLCQDQQAEDQGSFVAFPLAASGISELL
jgi:hypothetical protein